MPPPNTNDENSKFNVTSAEDLRSSISNLGDLFVDLGVNMLKEDSLKTLRGFLSGTKPDKKDFPYSTVFIQSEIAHEFGDGQTQSEWTKSLNEEMKFVSFGAVKALKTAKNNGTALTWDNVLPLLNNENFITAVPDSHKKSYETFDSSEGMNYFKFDGAPSKTKTNEITAWFKQSLTALDPEIWDSSALVKHGVVEKLAEISAETGAAVNNFKTFFANRDERYDKVLELGIVRFPQKGDPHNKLYREPHVKLYRIQLFLWFASSRIVFAQNDKAGFDMEVDVMEFKQNQVVFDVTANDEFMAKVTEKLTDPETFDF